MTKNYELWIWTELVAFDHKKEDMGVKSYLDILGFTPHAICLFVSSPDFILLYSDEDYNSVLPKDGVNRFFENSVAVSTKNFSASIFFCNLVSGKSFLFRSVFLSTFSYK